MSESIDETREATSGVISPGAMLCPRCATAYLVRQPCKTLCEQCGYVESCEDNFLPLQDNPK